MNNYQPEDARWVKPRVGDAFDDSPLDSDESLFLKMADEEARHFDLLSAYLDNEVTLEERREVQHWLDTDPDIKKLYHQLRGLQTNLQQIPVPVSVPTDHLVERVFQHVDRQRNRRLFLYGGAVLTAMAIAIVSHGLWGRDNSMSQMAKGSINLTRESDSLMIALNSPIIEIPETKESSRQE
jgi:anti-sigma factor RsiW